MIVRAQILDMGEFARMGFTLECYGCEVVRLLHDGEMVIGLKQTEATEQDIQAECARHLLFITAGTAACGGGETKVKELECLIHFWKDNLSQYRLLMSPFTVYLVEQTVRNLEGLKQIREAENGSRSKAFGADKEKRLHCHPGEGTHCQEMQ
jgi:hypothetical protein